MPKYQKKTYAKKAKKWRRSRAMVNRSPVARKMITKIRYAEQFDLNPTAATAIAAIYSANGCYDPRIATGGHQPRGFDQLMALYDHYVVLGSKIQVHFDNTGNAGAAQVGIALKDNSTGDTDIENYMENGNLVQKYAGPAGAPQTTLSMGCNPNKFLGRSKPLADSQLKGSTSSNPTEQAYYHVFAADTDGLTNLAAIHCTVTIDYIVALIEPKQPTKS